MGSGSGIIIPIFIEIIPIFIESEIPLGVDSAAVRLPQRASRCRG
jgi:hypothetical protein